MARKWTALQHTCQAILKKSYFHSLLVPRLRLGTLPGDSGSVRSPEPESQVGIPSRSLGTRKYRRVILMVLFFVSFMVVVGLAHRVSAIAHNQPRSSPQTLIERSQIQLNNGDLSGAIQTQQTAVERLRQDPTQQVNVAISLTNLGRLNLQAGHFNAATDQFTEADRLYAIAPVTDRHRLQNRGYQAQALRQLGQYQTACLKLVNTLWLDSPSDPGRSLCDTGTLEDTALESLDPVIAQQSELLQSQLLRELGITLRVLGHLQASANILSEFPFQHTDEATQLSLANTKRAQGNLIRDRLASPRYDAIPWRFEPEVFSATVVGRGGTPTDDYQAMQDYYQHAQEFYTEIYTQTEEPTEKPIEEPIERSTKQQHNSTLLNVKAQLNHLSLQLDQIALLSKDDTQYEPRINAALEFVQTLDISRLPVGQSKIFAQITMARYQTFLNQLLDTEAFSWSQIQTLLDDAMEEAEALDNPHVLSYVLGNKGGLYEYFAGLEPPETVNADQWRDRAARLTQAALVKAQPLDDPDIAYQWQWQLGRLDRMGGNREGAIAHYKEAVNTLQAVRKDLLNIKADVRFSFRDNVEPIYRGLVDALLTNPSTQDIEAAVQTIDGLQLAELESFLRCRLDGAINVHQQLDEIDPKAAFIYPIILRDRLEVIAKLPGQPLQHHFISIPSTTVESELKLFYRSLLRKNASNVTTSGNNIYGWLLKPIEDQLENQSDIDTLVFVPDTSFRRISPSALYDRDNKQYVLEKDYATVLVPSPQLFNLNQTRRTPQILGIGVSEEQEIQDQNKTRIFPAITNAANEVEIFESLSIPNKVLLDTEATEEKISDELKENNPSIIHFATHGEFSSDPENTFIVLYQDLLKSYEFDNLLKKANTSNGFDLLTLGACKTAQGDNRAVLGLAGLAVRTQANSTLASLWKIQDEPTVRLMERFYQEMLNPEIKTAEALHRAQLSLRGNLNTQNPYIWSSFILVGNWL